MRKTTILLFSIFLLCQTLFSSPIGGWKHPDFLMYEGEKLIIETYENSIWTHKNFKNINKQIISAVSNRTNSDRIDYNEYYFEWRMKNERLTCSKVHYKEQTYLLEELLNKKTAKEIANMKWYSGSFYANKDYLFGGLYLERAIYKYQLEFKFSKGKISSIKTYDNSQSKYSEYVNNFSKLYEFIKSNINWDELPDINELGFRVFVTISANEPGIIDTAFIRRGHDSIFDKEAIRVAKLIPEWEVDFYLGEFKRTWYTIPINFKREDQLEHLNNMNGEKPSP